MQRENWKFETHRVIEIPDDVPPDRWQFMDKQQDTSSNMPVPLLDVTEPQKGANDLHDDA